MQDHGRGTIAARDSQTAPGRRSRPRQLGVRLRGVAAAVVAAMLVGTVVIGSAAPSAAAPSSCPTGELVPSLRELMVSQGLPSFPSLVRGKETLVRPFLSKPACAAKNQTISVTGVTVAVSNTTASPAVALGSGTAFSPTAPVSLPSYYTGTPPANSPSDPILTVPGKVLTPCGADASCADATAGFDATFAVTVTFTASGVTGAQTVTFQSSKPVAQKSNALRVLVVPMGDANQLRSSQYTLAADAAVQQGFNTLSRILPVPCDADPADTTGACFATSLRSAYGGVRYEVSPGTLDLRSVTGAYDSAGRFCGTQSNWEQLKATLAQFLQSWNTANPATPADRVMGVVDEAISSGVGTSPTGYSCADGMAATGSVAAWARAMYSAQPSRTGGILAMELSHTFGGVPYPRSTTTHSLNAAADGTAPGRGWNLIQRAYITNSRSAMKYGTDGSLPWNNDTTLFEPLDFQLMHCQLGGPTGTECATSGQTGAVTGAGAGITVVASGTLDFAAQTADVVTSYRTDDVAQPKKPDPVAPDPTSATRLVITGPIPANFGIPVSRPQSHHDDGDDNGSDDSDLGLFSFGFEGVPGMTGFAVWHCPSGTEACKADPAANGGVQLYERHQQSARTAVDSAALNQSGALRDWTNDATRSDTNPAIEAGGVAWVAPCTGCSTTTSIHLAPAADVTKVVEIPLSGGLSQIDPAWRSDGAAVVWSAGGDLYTAVVNRATQPYVVSNVTKIYAQGGSNPPAAAPSWSLDKSTIYFAAANGGIRSIPAAGGKSSPLVATSAKEGHPSASQTAGDGRLAYTKQASGGLDVWIVDPAKPSKTQQLLIAGADQPFFGDDGRVIVRQGGVLKSLRPDGTDLKVLTPGSDDANPSQSDGILALDRLQAGDRDVWLAALNQQTVSAQYTKPADAPLPVGELRLTCADGSVHPVAVGVPASAQSVTQGTFEANYDQSGACGGVATLQWVCSDGFDLCASGPSSQITVVNTNKAPVAAITSPSADLVVSPTANLALNGSASSLQGQLTGAGLRWYASSNGGPEVFLGSGNAFDLAAPAGGWAPGQLRIRLEATDAGGRVGSATRDVIVDGIAPTVTVAEQPANPSASNAATFTFSVADTGGSTSTTVLCQLDTDQPAPCTSPVTYTDLLPGEHTVVIYVWDEAGNLTMYVYTWVIDLGPPVTVATVSPGPNQAGWYDGDPTVVTLTASDGSDVQSVTYSLSGAQSGGATVPGSSASVPITAEGTTTVTYYATDTTGQAEAPRQLVVQVDHTPATASVDSAPLLCTTLLGCTVTGAAADNLSGVVGVTVGFRNVLTGTVTSVPAACTACGAGGLTATWSADPIAAGVGLGIYAVSATAADLAGNPGQPSAEVPLEITLI